MSKKTVLASLLVIISIILTISVIVILMRGETKIENKQSAIVQGESLTCESAAINYPFFRYDNSNSKNLKVVANFYDDMLSAMSLEYTLHYNDRNYVDISEAQNHAEMNHKFGENSLDADAYHTVYSKTDNSLIMRMYITSSEMNPTAARFFMLTTPEQYSIARTLSEFQTTYEAQGFKCQNS